MESLFSIDPGLHPHNACFSSAMVYTHTMLAFHWLRLTSTLCLFFIGHGLHPRNTYSSLVTACTHTFFSFLFWRNEKVILSEFLWVCIFLRQHNHLFHKTHQVKKKKVINIDDQKALWFGTDSFKLRPKDLTVLKM